MTVSYDGRLRLVSNGGMDTRIEPCCRDMDLATIDGFVGYDYDQDAGGDVLILVVFTKMNISKEVRIYRCPWCGALWNGEANDDGSGYPTYGRRIYPDR